MTNDSIQTTLTGQTFTQWLAGLIRRAAGLLAPETAQRPTIVALKQQLAYDVEISLLSAQAGEERYRHTVNMLRERLRRLEDHGQSNPTAGVPESADRRPAEGVLGGNGNDRSLSVPVGRPALAEPQAADGKVDCRDIRPVRRQGDDSAAVVRGSAGGDVR